MKRIIGWLERLSARAERDRESLGITEDSFVGRLVDKADRSTENIASDSKSDS